MPSSSRKRPRERRQIPTRHLQPRLQSCSHEVQPQTDSGLSLEDYLDICAIGETETAIQEEVPLDELARSFQEQAELLESVEAPAEVADWHDAVVVYQGAVAEAFEGYLEDPQGQSEDEFLLTTVLSLAIEYQPDIDRALAEMDSDARARLLEAGCIDEESAEEHSGLGMQVEEVEREEIPFGVALERSLDEPEEKDTYEISVEAGETYLIEVSWQGLPSMKLTVFQPPGYNWIFQSELSPITGSWTPEIAGATSISVSAEDATGPYTIYLSQHRSLDAPGRVSAAWEGSDARITWEQVEGADYYKLYHEEFFDSKCAIDPDGEIRWCTELATNVAENSFVHTSPPTGEENQYWVSACNSDGCSLIDSENHATLSDADPGGPAGGGPCRTGTELKQGQSCSVNIPGLDAGTNLFEVRDGMGCYGDTCAADSLNLSGFLAQPNFDGGWRIVNLPRAEAPIPTATPTP